MTGLQAAVLIAQFERLPEQIERRTASASQLRELTSTSSDIVWQQVPAQITRNCYYLLCGRVLGGRAQRDLLLRRLSEAGVPASPFYPHTLYQNPLYRQPGSCRVLPCPNAEAYVEDAFWLPHRVLLSDPETIEEIGALLQSAAS
jgi:dTDP-4-amino-4,6-dideoxygalactose transaminase